MSVSKRYLYRIVRFDRLVQTLRSNDWYFAHPSQWEDPYESRSANPHARSLYAQCWCRDGVSDAMWRIYSPDKLGVRIRVRQDAFEQALSAAAKRQRLHFRVQQVRYINPIEELVDAHPYMGEEFAQSSAHLFMKRTAFRHEAETRAVVQPLLCTDASAYLNGLTVNMNARRLIDSVLVDPRAPDEYVEAYSALLCGNLKFHGPVEKSRLYRGAVRREP